MMTRSFSSSILGHGGSVAEPQMGTELSNYGNHKHPICSCAGFKKSRSHKGEEPFSGKISATFTRALSDSNLMPLFARDEEVDNQRLEKLRSRRLMCSRKHGLLSMAADGKGELNTEQDQSEAVGSLSEGGYKRPATHKMNHVEDENLMDGYSGIETGAKGMTLVCTERGCRPAVLCEEQSITQGIDDGEAGVEVSRAGSKGRSSPADSISTDEYYQKMLEANPQNPLLLRNYAKFLHEVQGDMERAEKCYGRAILASPGDGEILSLYAKFIWETTNDTARAETYFERSVKAASEDCYVLGSYANFLWDSENNEDENDLV